MSFSIIVREFQAGNQTNADDEGVKTLLRFSFKISMADVWSRSTSAVLALHLNPTSRYHSARDTKPKLFLMNMSYLMKKVTDINIKMLIWLQQTAVINSMSRINWFWSSHQADAVDISQPNSVGMPRLCFTTKSGKNKSGFKQCRPVTAFWFVKQLCFAPRSAECSR